MKIFNVTKLSILSVLAASACCLPALVLLVFSIGSATVGAALARYHWWFLSIGVVLLGISYWLFFSEKKSCSSKGCAMKNRTLTTISLVLATLIVGALAVNTIMPMISSSAVQQESPSFPNQARATLQVQGMTCYTCELHVKKVLKEISGVVDVQASTAGKSARVTFDSSQFNVDDLVNAINTRTGYKASWKGEE